jgi:hypothetical protein
MASSGGVLTSNVYKEQERDLSLRTQFNEMCRFQGRLREQNSIVRHDTHRVPMNMSKALQIVSDDNEQRRDSDVR